MLSWRRHSNRRRRLMDVEQKEEEASLSPGAILGLTVGLIT